MELNKYIWFEFIFGGEISGIKTFFITITDDKFSDVKAVIRIFRSILCTSNEGETYFSFEASAIIFESQQTLPLIEVIVWPSNSLSQQFEGFCSHIPQEFRETECIILQWCNVIGIPTVENKKIDKRKYVTTLFFI